MRHTFQTAIARALSVGYAGYHAHEKARQWTGKTDAEIQQDIQQGRPKRIKPLSKCIREERSFRNFAADDFGPAYYDPLGKPVYGED